MGPFGKELLGRVAVKLSMKNWTQGYKAGNPGNTCLSIACGDAAREMAYERDEDAFTYSDTMLAVRDLLMNRLNIPIEDGNSDYKSWEPLVSWNDADGRTKDEVVDLVLGIGYE